MTVSNLPPDAIARRIDARGLFCPAPILKLSAELRALEGGDVVELRATDPGAEGDVVAFCKAMRHVLLGAAREGDCLTLWVRKRPG